MSAGKTFLRRAASAVIESGGYNAGGAVTYPGDAFHVHEDINVDPQYQFDGTRAGTSAGSSMQLRDSKQGRFIDVSLSHRVRCPNIAYAAAVYPTVDRLLRAHGMTRTLNTSAGVEKITYAPFTDGTWESLTGELYEGKEKYVYQGGYVYKWVHTADAQGTPVWQFSLKAPLAARAVDAALPAISAYPYAGVGSPKAAGSILTIAPQFGGGGTFQGKVHRSVVTSERTIDDMMSQALATTASASGHAGFQLGRYTQTMEVAVEATAIPGSYSTASTLDPERLMEEAFPLVITVGFQQAVQYNRYKFLAPSTAQITEAKKDKAGSIRLWNLTIACPPSSDVVDDGLSVVFD